MVFCISKRFFLLPLSMFLSDEAFFGLRIIDFWIFTLLQINGWVLVERRSTSRVGRYHRLGHSERAELAANRNSKKFEATQCLVYAMPCSANKVKYLHEKLDAVIFYLSLLTVGKIEWLRFDVSPHKGEMRNICTWRYDGRL